MIKESWNKLFNFKNNTLFLFILILLLTAGNIYQYNKIRELNISFDEMKDELISGKSFLGGNIELVNWEDPENPAASLPITEEELPEGSINIEMSDGKIIPEEFSVKTGEQVVFSVTALDKVHVLKFKEEVLSDVAVGVAKGETKTITFYAPEESGDYHMYCDVPGHKGESLMKVVK